MVDHFLTFPLAVNLVLFAVLAAGVWLAGTRLAYLADEMSDAFGLPKSLIGLLMLSLATSLPEVATTLAAAVRQDQALVLNNLFGGIALQTAILATADMWARGAITNYPRKPTHALEAALLAVLMAITLVVILLDEPLAWGPVGAGSVVIGLVYMLAVILLRRYDQGNDWIPVDLPDEEPRNMATVFRGPSGRSHQRLVVEALIASAFILVFGVGLVSEAEVIADQTGLGRGFVGVTLLAAATSLPELTTSIAAVRIGAYTMAISNIFGSNFIMLVLVLPADALIVSGPILRGVGPTAMLAICFGIIVTGIFLAGLLVRRKPRLGRLGIDSVAVIVVYLVSLWAYYAVR